MYHRQVNKSHNNFIQYNPKEVARKANFNQDICQAKKQGGTSSEDLEVRVIKPEGFGEIDPFTAILLAGAFIGAAASVGLANSGGVNQDTKNNYNSDNSPVVKGVRLDDVKILKTIGVSDNEHGKSLNMDLYSKGTNNYVVSGNLEGDVAITNITDTAKPTLKNIYGGAETIHDVEVKGDAAFVLEDREGANYITKIDLKNPDNPKIDERKELDEKHTEIIDINKGLYLRNNIITNDHVIVNENLDEVEELSDILTEGAIKQDENPICRIKGAIEGLYLALLDSDLNEKASTTVDFEPEGSFFWSVAKKDDKLYLGISDTKHLSENTKLITYKINGENLEKINEINHIGEPLILGDHLLTEHAPKTGVWNFVKSMLNMEKGNTYVAGEQTSKDIVFCKFGDLYIGSDDKNLKTFEMNKPEKIKPQNATITAIKPNPVNDLVNLFENPKRVVDVHVEGISQYDNTQVVIKSDSGEEIVSTVSPNANGSFETDMAGGIINIFPADVVTHGLADALMTAANQHGNFKVFMYITDDNGFAQRKDIGLHAPTIEEQRGSLEGKISNSYYGQVLSPVAWIITDKEGRIIGYNNGKIINQLGKDGYISKDGEFVYIKPHVNLKEVKLIGTERGHHTSVFSNKNNSEKISGSVHKGDIIYFMQFFGIN